MSALPRGSSHAARGHSSHLTYPSAELSSLVPRWLVCCRRVKYQGCLARQARGVDIVFLTQMKTRRAGRGLKSLICRDFLGHSTFLEDYWSFMSLPDLKDTRDCRRYIRSTVLPGGGPALPARSSASAHLPARQERHCAGRAGSSETASHWDCSGSAHGDLPGPRQTSLRSPLGEAFHVQPALGTLSESKEY